MAAKAKQADRGKPGRVVGRAIIDIAEQHDGEDRRPADVQQRLGEVVALARPRQQLLPKEDRQDHVVRHHDRQRDGGDDHHGGGGREAAKEGDERDQCHLVMQRQREHVEIGVAGTTEGHDAAHGGRKDEDVDGHQIKRHQDPGKLQFARRSVLDHSDMELPRQHDDGKRRERDQQHPAADRRLVGKRGHHGLVLGSLLPEVGRAVEQEENHIDAKRPEGDELHHRFHGDCQDQPILMLGRVRMARTEHDGEAGEQEGDDQRQVDEVEIAGADAVFGRIDHRRHRARDGLKLERDIGNGSDQADDGDKHADNRILAVARSHEVGAGGQFLRLGQFDDPPHDRHSDREHQDRPDIDRREFQAAVGGEPDPAEIGPGGAIDREAQRIDDRPPAFRDAVHTALPVAVAGHCEEQQQIGEGRGKDDPSRKHASSSRTALQIQSNIRGSRGLLKSLAD